MGSSSRNGTAPPVRVGERETKNILGRTRLPGGGLCANPYVGCEHACRYCYASFMTRYAGHSEPWGAFVDAKNWKDIGRPEKYKDKAVALGSVTDPYQPAEKRFGRTRRLLEQLQGSGCRLSVLTKSDLIVRDLDLIREFEGATVAFSVNTLDEDFRRDMDRAAAIERRVAAMQTFHDAGVHTACFVAPVFPCITEPEELLGALRGRAHEVWFDRLNLRGPNRPVILDYIAERWPGFLPLYEAIYLRGDNTYWRELNAQLRLLAVDFPGTVTSFICEHDSEGTAAGETGEKP